MNLIGVLLVYLLTLFIKALAFYYSSLAVILADVLHSIADISLLLILIVSEKISKRIPDKLHPFGHGMLKHVASLTISVAFITLISFELFKEGYNRIISPQVYENLEIALLAEILVLILLLSVTSLLRRRESIITRTAMLESLNDSLSTFSAIFGIFAVMHGHSIFDGIMTIIIAFLITYNSSRLFLENVRFLLGMSPSEEFYSRLEKSMREVHGVGEIYEMVAVYTAENEIHLDVKIRVDGSMRVEEAESISKNIIEKIKKDFPEIKHISIHFCPLSGNRRKIYI